MDTSAKSTILVVDDTEANIDVLVETLGDEYDVSVAMDGKTALEDILANRPDLILLDIMMPDIDGYEVCRIIKEDVTTKDIPVIFITALSEVEDETKGLGLGAVDYITKPISPPVVKARVKNHIELKLAREELQKQNRVLQENIHLREEIDRISRHDLKTPLNSIISIPRILLQKSPNLEPDKIHLLEAIEKSGHTMLNMINLSLDLFKMEKGTYKLKPVNIDILGIIKTIIFDLRGISDQKSIGFSLRINNRTASDDDIFHASGEELLCYSMFANLVRNAVEASPKSGTVTIVFSDPQDDTDSSRSFSVADYNQLTSPVMAEKNIHNVQITINNQGVVPASIKESFFEKYTTAGKKGGTGLGTYSAKLMAETLGGKISMSTNNMDGTTVAVLLRSTLCKDRPSLPVQKKAETLSSSLPTTASAMPAKKFPSLSIMVVDDDEYNRFIIERCLDCPGLSIELAENGDSAFRKFTQSHFDMLFMDMEMPVMNGIDAVGLIRKWEHDKKERKSAIIVALSGHDDPDFIRACISLGFDGYLSKPVSSRQLHETILSFFGSNQIPDLPDREKLNSINPVNHKESDAAGIVDIDADLEDLIPSFMGDKQAEIEMIYEILNKSGLPDHSDYDRIKQLGHKLKGGFNMYGFRCQGTISSKIETAAVQKDICAIKDNTDILRSSLENVKIRYMNMD